MVDVVMQAPDAVLLGGPRRAGGGAAVAAAGRRPLAVPPARVRRPPTDLVGRSTGSAARGSHGVVLKAPDVPGGHRGRPSGWRGAGIPVVTLVTDLPGSGRLAYVGIDNRAAGRDRRLPDRAVARRPAAATCW